MHHAGSHVLELKPWQLMRSSLLVPLIFFFLSLHYYLTVFNKMKTLVIALFSSFQGKNWSVKWGKRQRPGCLWMRAEDLVGEVREYTVIERTQLETRWVLCLPLGHLAMPGTYCHKIAIAQPPGSSASESLAPPLWAASQTPRHMPPRASPGPSPISFPDPWRLVHVSPSPSSHWEGVAAKWMLLELNKWTASWG